MPKRLVGIFVCLLLANVVNYALGEWVTDFRESALTPCTITEAEDLTRYQEKFTAEPHCEIQVLLSSPKEYFAYLDGGGSQRLLEWEATARQASTTNAPFSLRAFYLAKTFNTERILAIFLLLASLLLLWGGWLKETYWTTPPLYFLISLSTAALYAHLDAPLFLSLYAGSWMIYYVGLRLALPIYHSEWSRLIRPSLTPHLFLLATIAWRGPDLVDLWFWTSPLYRLGLTFVVLLAAYFHFSMLIRVLAGAKMKRVARYFAVGIPLGMTLLAVGLFLGLYTPGGGTALSLLNYELVLLPAVFVDHISPDAPLVLALGGFLVLIACGIGYFVQRIAH